MLNSEKNQACIRSHCQVIHLSEGISQAVIRSVENSVNNFGLSFTLPILPHRHVRNCG